MCSEFSEGFKPAKGAKPSFVLVLTIFSVSDTEPELRVYFMYELSQVESVITAVHKQHALCYGFFATMFQIIKTQIVRNMSSIIGKTDKDKAAVDHFGFWLGAWS